MRPVRFHFRLTHKIAAIGCVGVIGLAAVGVIYQQGTWAQDGVRKAAEDARAISGLTKRISIEMLEARRDEKNFLLRKQDSYVKHHAQLSGAIGRDFDELRDDAARRAAPRPDPRLRFQQTARQELQGVLLSRGAD